MASPTIACLGRQTSEHGGHTDANYGESSARPAPRALSSQVTVRRRAVRQEALTVCASSTPCNVTHTGPTRARDMANHRTECVAGRTAEANPREKRQFMFPREGFVSRETGCPWCGCNCCLGGVHQYRGKYSPARHTTDCRVNRARSSRRYSANKRYSTMACGTKGSTQNTSRCSRAANTHQPLYESQSVIRASQPMCSCVGSADLVPTFVPLQAS
jgi:hypothetical protein